MKTCDYTVLIAAGVAVFWAAIVAFGVGMATHKASSALIVGGCVGALVFLAAIFLMVTTGGNNTRGRRNDG